MNYNYLCILDLDGVLIDSRPLHYKALNMAIQEIIPNSWQQFIITEDEHYSTYDGLPTKKKLELLSKNKGLPERFYNDIWKTKQNWTVKLMEEIERSPKLIDICSYFESKNIDIVVASNAIKETVNIALEKLGISRFISEVYTPENSTNPKPRPDMYWLAMMDHNAIPATTVIVEDSHIGRQGALDSGAFLLPVEDPDDLTLNKVIEAFENIMKNKKTNDIPWIDSKLNVVIPMAGAGSRFAKAGYTFPKPLIEVNGKPMIQVVVENLNIKANYIYIVQKEHYEKYHLQYLLTRMTPGCKIIQIDGLTQGAACTILAAKEFIDNDNPILIANSDQYMEWNSNECMYAFSAEKVDGGILTFTSNHPKWSFVKLDFNGYVEEVAEKKPISDMATTGVYYWSKGSDFVHYAQKMIDNNDTVNGEYYVAPVYNWAILDGKKIRTKKVDKMLGLGTPEDLETFLREYER